MSAELSSGRDEDVFLASLSQVWFAGVLLGRAQCIAQMCTTILLSDIYSLGCLLMWLLWLVMLPGGVGLCSAVCSAYMYKLCMALLCRHLSVTIQYAELPDNVGFCY